MEVEEKLISGGKPNCANKNQEFRSRTRRNEQGGEKEEEEQKKRERERGMQIKNGVWMNC